MFLVLALISAIHFAGADQGTYELSEKLCYLYKFRKNNNLRLRNTDPFLEDNVIKRNWNDQKLQESLAARRSILKQSFVTLFDGNDPTTITYLKNIYIQNLIDSAGFKAAMRECSQHIGADAEALVRKDLKLGDFVLSNTPLFVGGGFAARGIFLGSNRLLSFMGITSKAAPYAVMGAVVGIATYVSYESLKEQDVLIKDVKQFLSNGNSLMNQKILEGWGHKQVLMASLIKSYVRLQNKHKQNITILQTDEDLIEFDSYLKYLRENRSIFEKKLTETLSKYPSKDIEAELQKLILKKNKTTLSYEERLQYEDFVLIVLLESSLKILTHH